MARDSSAASPSVSMRNQVFGGASHTNCIATLPAFAPDDPLPSPYFVAQFARQGDGGLALACERIVSLRRAGARRIVRAEVPDAPAGRLGMLAAMGAPQRGYGRCPLPPPRALDGYDEPLPHAVGRGL